MANQTNRLAREQSPYLLQHAHNPVDWYPWGDEAWAKAKAEDKPVLLSVGYATCHWCHVMERESFEDQEVARLLNETLVCIKVDREERPDIDAVYMNVCHLLTGSGGWPLNVFLTPEGKPFFAGTYFPKESRFGRMGLVELLPKLQELWRSQRSDIEASASSIVDHVRQMDAAEPGPQLGPELLPQAVAQLAQRFDASHGGFGGAPKFPSPHVLVLLLRHHGRSHDPATLAMATQTLTAMRLGGVYDQLGFGLHRYATDEGWLLPHFEKMLYDQAMALMAYATAARRTGEALYRQTCAEIRTYLARDMTDPLGGFYSAEDADSEGIEGKFYVWSAAEIDDLLGADAPLFRKVYGLRDEGNFHDEATGRLTGENILHLSAPLADSAQRLGQPVEALQATLAASRTKLLAARAGRIRPLRDDKVLTDWNGLMIAALAMAAQELDDPDYLPPARAAADFHLAHMYQDGRLWHRWRQGQAGISGFAADYAFLAWGLAELHAASGEPRYLEAARALAHSLEDHFADGTRGGYFTTADDAETVLVRQKDLQDHALPAANSGAMYALVRLSQLTGDQLYAQRAAQVGQAMAGMVRRAPSAFAMVLCAVDQAQN